MIIMLYIILKSLQHLVWPSLVRFRKDYSGIEGELGGVETSNRAKKRDPYKMRPQRNNSLSGRPDGY